MRWRVAVGICVLALGVGGCAPPISVVPPMVTGAPGVGATLTATPGVWILPGTDYNQWQRCRRGGSPCADLTGAASAAYTVVAADAGKRLRVRVTNTNAYGTKAASSAVSALVPGLPATKRISLSSNGTEGDAGSQFTTVSGDGRYVVFTSEATNLVAGDTNGVADVFVHDTLFETTERASLSSGGAQADAISYLPDASSDGRYVEFHTEAANLVAGDTNGVADVFVRDRENGTTQRVAVDSGGAQSDGASRRASLSGDGRYVAFYSEAANLVAGDTNGVADVFVHDRQSGTTQRVSVDSGGAQATGGNSFRPVLSAGGDYVVFTSYATNLVAGDTNATRDEFLRDLQSGTTERVSVGNGGVESNGDSYYAAVSADGRYVSFHSDGSNLVAGDTNGGGDVFVRDRQTGTTERVSVATGGTQGNASSHIGSMSTDGRYVVFFSDATNLVSGDTNGVPDVFVRDRVSATTERVSVATDGTQADSGSYDPWVSADGHYVVFHSPATNLVELDTNAANDVFLHERP